MHASSPEVENYLKQNEMKNFSAFFTGTIFEHFVRKCSCTRKELENLISATCFGNGEIRKGGTGFYVCLRRQDYGRRRFREQNIMCLP
jgi:hypothetical protein